MTISLKRGERYLIQMKATHSLLSRILRIFEGKIKSNLIDYGELIAADPAQQLIYI